MKALFTIASILATQSFAISGIVTRANGKPIRTAEVKLLSNGATTTTNQRGVFNLEVVGTNSRQDLKRYLSVEVKTDGIWVGGGFPGEKLHLQVMNPSGQKLFDDWMDGSFRGRIDRPIGAGLFVVALELGRDVHLRRTIAVTSGGASGRIVVEHAPTVTEIGARAAESGDTLIVTKDEFYSEKIPVSSLSPGHDTIRLDRNDSLFAALLGKRPNQLIAKSVDSVVSSVTTNSDTLVETIQYRVIGDNFWEVVRYSPQVQLGVVDALSFNLGVPQPIGFEGQTPLTVSIDDLNLVDNQRLVQNPTPANISSAIADILRSNFKADSVVNGAFMSYEFQSNVTDKMMARKFGLDATYGNLTVNSTFQSSKEIHTKAFYSRFFQKFFTVNLGRLPKGINYFDNSSVYSDFDIKPDNMPVLINNIKVGRMFIFRFETDESVDETKFELAVKYKMLNSNLSIEQKEMISKASVQVLVLGGDPVLGCRAISSREFDSLIINGAKFSISNPGVPLVYSAIRLDRGMQAYGYGSVDTFTMTKTSLASGDFQWAGKKSRIDHGHENSYELQRDGSPAGAWAENVEYSSNGALGSLKVHAGQDEKFYGRTNIWVMEEKNFNLTLKGDGMTQFWVNDAHVLGNPVSIHLKKGWNSLEWTLTNENQSTSLTIEEDISSLIGTGIMTKIPHPIAK